MDRKEITVCDDITKREKLHKAITDIGYLFRVKISYKSVDSCHN